MLCRTDQSLDDKFLSLVKRDKADDGRKALQILRKYFLNVGKPKIIRLYTELNSLMKSSNETVTLYIIRDGETVSTLRKSKESLRDGLLIAMTLNGLP